MMVVVSAVKEWYHDGGVVGVGDTSVFAARQQCDCGELIHSVKIVWMRSEPIFQSRPYLWGDTMVAIVEGC